MVVSVDRQNEGILGLLFPGVPAFKDMLPPFQKGRVIVFSEKILNPAPYQELIQVKRAGGIRLDTKEGFLEYVEIGRKVSLTAKQRESLLALDDLEYWELAKLVMRGSRRAIKMVESRGSTFLLFKDLFSTFEISYKLYRETATPHEVVVSSLVTMMMKCASVDAPGLQESSSKECSVSRPI